MVNYAIPFNFVCAALTVLFVVLKLRDLKFRKSNGVTEAP